MRKISSSKTKNMTRTHTMSTTCSASRGTGTFASKAPPARYETSGSNETCTHSSKTKSRQKPSPKWHKPIALAFLNFFLPSVSSLRTSSTTFTNSLFWNRVPPTFSSLRISTSWFCVGVITILNSLPLPSSSASALPTMRSNWIHHKKTQIKKMNHQHSTCFFFAKRNLRRRNSRTPPADR